MFKFSNSGGRKVLAMSRRGGGWRQKFWMRLGERNEKFGFWIFRIFRENKEDMYENRPRK